MTGATPDGGEPQGPPGAQPRPDYPSPMAYAGIGMLKAICVLGGGALGWLLDSAAGTLPLFMLLCLVLGAALGVAGTRSELRRQRR